MNYVWRVVKGRMAAVDLDPRYATHTCRHTYATHLYRASGADLKIVQEQLGHASIKTTTIYAKVTKEDKARAADTLAKTYRDSQRNSTSGASSSRRRPGSPGVPPGSVASP
ncbi:MAG: tyrosine-type recombinase/integrase [Candidatus Methylomirabilales bacterium]